MPYNGVPDEKTADMDSCVEKVMGQGQDKDSAVAICMKSIMEGMDLDEAMRTFTLDATIAEPVQEAATIKSRVRAAIKALDELLGEKDVPELMKTQVKNLREAFRKTWADLGSEVATGKVKERFAESYAGVEIIENDAALSPARSPLTMRVKLIRPGWGNQKDNHYYPAEVLKRDSHIFEGVKMYTTDHKAGEKSERTEVSVIEKIDGFADDGAPIAQVKVFDPDFAEKVRSRQSAGHLDKLECSVLGGGTARPFELDGRKGKLIESITDAESVDWVTRAGAGGHALEIAESESDKTNTTLEGATMADQTQIEVTPVESPVTETVAPVAEVAEEQAATAPEVTSKIPPESQAGKLSEAEVTALLEAEKRLPAASRVRLAESAYPTTEDVNKAILKELEYLKEVLGSGQPFGLGASSPAVSLTPAEREAKVLEALDRVNLKYLGG